MRVQDGFIELLQFGAGYNQCPGRHLAHLEVSKVVATLLRDFEIEQINPGQSWTFETHFTAVPYDWPCRVKRRRSVSSREVPS
jgi:cytochrome P450